MGTRTKLACALLAAGALIAGCSGANSVVRRPPSGDVLPAQSSASTTETRAAQLATEALLPLAIQEKLRTGYHFQISGTAHGADVALGRDPRFSFGPGDYVEVKLVPAAEPRYLISGFRPTAPIAAVLPVDCADCVGGGGSQTPAPRATAPPNYGPCSSSGGATWFNNASGEGGCTPRGGSKPLSCGVWSWSSRGRGTLTQPGGIPLTDFDWITDNGDGSCGLGYF